MKLVLCCVVIFGIALSHSRPNEKLKFIKASEHFFVSTEALPFIGAWIECKTGGMELASIETEEEQMELNNATEAAKYQSSDGYWIGGANIESGYDTWYWLESGLRFVYTNWGTNQPNYQGSYYSRQCVRLGNFYKVNQPYMWENTDCNFQLYYVCKVKTS